MRVEHPGPLFFSPKGNQMLGDRFSVEYSGKPERCNYEVSLDGDVVREFSGFNITVAYLAGHGVLHTDAVNMVTKAFEAAQIGMSA